jgi:hypothetical protein
MRYSITLLLLSLAACSGDAPAPQPDETATAAPAAGASLPNAAPTPAPAPAPASAPASAPPASDAGDAAGALRRYYDLVEAGRYSEAWAMRGGAPRDAAAFAASFADYSRYKVTVGQPSEPVSGGGWSFVEVPIQIFGAMKTGKPFGSAGSVTLRRASGAPGATPRQRDWHIYTGD